MEGSDSATSPAPADLELAARALDLHAISDTDAEYFEKFLPGRRTLVAVCAFALLQAVPDLRGLIDVIPHCIYDVGHIGGNRCFRCDMKELTKYMLNDYSEMQRIRSSLFAFRNWEPNSTVVDLQALMDEILSEICHWCLEKDRENMMSMTMMRFSFMRQINDLFLFDCSTKWGCYNCGVHFTRTTSNRSIYMGGSSISEFQGESGENCLDCSECKIPTGYKVMTGCSTPEILTFYEVSDLLPHFRVLHQDYELACVLPVKNKARMYCLIEMNWTCIDTTEFDGLVRPLGPVLPSEVLSKDKCAIAIYKRT
uniref:USP domain-containing protein n=1 Tax=Leersia perrieri TaxID=77586 RepID=A0A0D9WJX1_9ORYZ